MTFEDLNHEPTVSFFLSFQLVKEEKIGGVISMNESYELYLSNNEDEWRGLGVRFLQLPTVDIFSAPCQKGLERGVDFIRYNMYNLHT